MIITRILARSARHTTFVDETTAAESIGKRFQPTEFETHSNKEKQRNVHDCYDDCGSEITEVVVRGAGPTQEDCVESGLALRKLFVATVRCGPTLVTRTRVGCRVELSMSTIGNCASGKTGDDEKDHE